MDFEKLTDRVKGFLNAAQSVAMNREHQRLLPEHLLKAMLDDKEGLAASLIQRAGGDPRQALAGVEAALGRIPAVTGDTGQISMDQTLARVLDEAQKLSAKAGDSFVTAERVLTALALVKRSGTAKILEDAGVQPQRLNDASAPGAPPTAPRPRRATTR